MPVTVCGNWITLDTANPDFWCDQSYLFRKDQVSYSRLVKAQKHGPDNGIEVVIAATPVMHNRFWMRYEKYEDAERDYRSLVSILSEGGD